MRNHTADRLVTFVASADKTQELLQFHTRNVGFFLEDQELLMKYCDSGLAMGERSSGIAPCPLSVAERAIALSAC
jgi:hypothetical protein